MASSSDLIKEDRLTFSVIIPAFNTEEHISRSIESVISQTYNNWEIVFWDNASSDESGSIARSYGEKVRYFRSDTTTNLGDARNKAFAQCKGEYIAILDFRKRKVYTLH